MSAEQKTSHRGFTIITVVERLSKGRARLSAKVLANDEDHKRRLGGKKLLHAKRWYDHFADDLAAPVIAGLKHTIDLELSAAAETTPKVAPKASVKSDSASAVAKAGKAAKAVKPMKPMKPMKPVTAGKVGKAGKAGKAENAVKPATMPKAKANTKAKAAEGAKVRGVAANAAPNRVASAKSTRA
ncbi:hypothetical protein [Pandoraea sp.]|uniref:hypothetical protein n=1 Tax=Pandoraea sp. TaxID=1883445 RepID=UPI0035AFCB41